MLTSRTGSQFSKKNGTMNLWKTYEKVRLTKNLGWASDFQNIWWKSYEKRRTKLCKTYDKLTTTLQISNKNVKFAASDVIQETLSQRLSLVEYFELKITDSWSYKFTKNAFEKLLTIFLRRSKEIVSHRLTEDLRKSYDELRKNLRKIWQSFKNRAHERHAAIHNIAVL